MRKIWTDGRTETVLQDHTPLTAGSYNPVGVGTWKYLLRFPSTDFFTLVSTSYLEVMYKSGVNRWKGKSIPIATILQSAIYDDDHYSHCLIGPPCNEGGLEMIKQHWKFWFNEVRDPSFRFEMLANRNIAWCRWTLLHLHFASCACQDKLLTALEKVKICVGICRRTLYLRVSDEFIMPLFSFPSRMNHSTSLCSYRVSTLKKTSSPWRTDFSILFPSQCQHQPEVARTDFP